MSGTATRREMLFGASAAVIGVASSPAWAVPPARPLREIARAGNFLFGAAFATAELTDGPTTQLYAEQVGLLVPDFELKWGVVHPSAGKYNLAPADQLLAFANTHNMAFRGHNLVWEESNPAWLKQEITSKNAEQLLRDHIDHLVDHFNGRVHSWDVVNEPIWPQHNQKNGLRNGVWLQALGERYIDIAFQSARAADPKALLVLNEAGTETASVAGHQRRARFLELIDRLQDRGVPIDAVGLECHFSTQSQLICDDFGAYLDELSRRHLRIIISELDVSDIQIIENSVADRDRAVAAIYDAVVSTAVRNPATIAVLTWELSDKFSWIRDSPHPAGNLPRPLPYDEYLQPKLAREVLAQSLNARQRL